MQQCDPKYFIIFEFLDPENLGVDPKIILLAHLVCKLWQYEVKYDLDLLCKDTVTLHCDC